MSALSRQRFHASSKRDRIDPGSFVLGIHCAVPELHRDRRAAAPLSSASPKRAIDFVGGAETLVPFQGLSTL